MFTPSTPILAANDQRSVDAQAVVARFEALRVVIAAVARIAGIAVSPNQETLSASADLAGTIGAMPSAITRQVATECDSIAIALSAGLIAVERARRAGQLNVSAAAMLYLEASEAFGSALNRATRACQT